MTDKVQKIKDWISKEQDGLMDAQGNFKYPEHEGASHILCKLDAYINSLQRETVSESLNTESMIESYKQRLTSQVNGMKNSPLIDMCLTSYKHGINETLDTLNLSNLSNTVKNCEDPASEGRDIFDNCLKSEEKFILPQKISGNINCENCQYSSACALGDIQECIIDKPVNEELEKTIDSFLATYFGSEKEKQEWPFLKKMAIHFAEWRKQKDSIPVSEELGEYINELSKQFPEVSFAKLSRIVVRVAKWQEQKYKEALNIYLNSQWNKGK